MDENKLKNFLINGFQPKEEREDPDEGSGEERIDEVTDDTEDYEVEDRSPRELPEDDFDIRTSMKDLETELIRIRYLVEDLRDSEPAMPDMSQYMTTREQFKSVTAAVSKRDAEAGYKALVNAMEAVSVMREDFFKLCQGMRERIDEMSAETVLSSFEAYSVDMENILTDGGVFIGAFPYDRLNTLHHRIVGVVPTGEADKDGMIAERLSDGYKIGDKVLLKEKVKVFKYDAKLAAPEETSSETPSETVSEPAGNEEADNKAENSKEEEE
ncbi:MAG: hypothetical protein A3205_04725 [Methanomassiliicoccales archaeon Mx-03]|nr:nucleotide exchange factor GrpE [Methanomassiliicoccaceae archaeon DOK]TQS80073.1 MAG: hypothetical protein A3205_04725 [Methanomassiliicoccales archaeon Mx-03]